MHTSKKVKFLTPLLLSAGIITAFADSQPAAEAKPAQVKVNSAPAEICKRSLPMLGVAFGNNVDPRQRGESRFGLPIIYVKKDSPAEQAGVQIGDLLLTLDGQKLFFPSQFAALLRTYEPGDSVEIRFRRGKEIINSKVKLHARDGHAISRTENNTPAVPVTNDRDDIRIVINGREISLSRNADLRNRVALTSDGIIIRTRTENSAPDDLQHIVERFRRILDIPPRFERRTYTSTSNFPVFTTSSRIFADNENTLVFMRENNQRELIVRSRKDGEIFRGPCATQEEIDAIPPNIREIIRKMTILRPLPGAETRIPEKEKKRS